MSSRKLLSTLGAGFVMASLAVSLGAGAAAAAADGQRTATSSHHVHKTYGSHRLYDYAGPKPYAYDSAPSEDYGRRGVGYRYGNHCIIPTPYSASGICW
jgi:hypothetical protein